MKGKSSNFIVFDIGSSKITAMAAQINKQGETQINAQILQYSEGFKSGIITDMTLAENTIVRAIYALEKQQDKGIKEVAISLSGSGIKSYYTNHKIKLGNQPISEADVKKLLAKALSDFKVKDQEIIHYFPMEYIIDGNQSVENPVGIYAKELNCQIHIIAADSLMLMNLTKCLAKCHVEVSDIIVSIYASAIACLNSDEKELGAIMIDIGSHTTSFGMFFENKIIYVNYIPIGSAHITADIAKTFSISKKAAEKLKILYGHATSDLIDRDTLIQLGDMEPNNSYNPNISINRGQLAEIIQPRLKEIFADIKKKCDHVSMDSLLARRVVITGGGAALPGTKNLAAEIFQKQARIAKPESIKGFIENYNPYIYSSAIGMVKTKSLNSVYDDEGGWLKKTFSWLKENI